MVCTGHNTNHANNEVPATAVTRNRPTIHFNTRRIALLPGRTDAYYKQTTLTQDVIVNRPERVARLPSTWLCLLLVSSMPFPVLGDSPRVTTVEAGVPVNIEKLSGSAELLEDRGGTLDIAAVRAESNPSIVAAHLASAHIRFSISAWWAHR